MMLEHYLFDYQIKNINNAQSKCNRNNGDQKISCLIVSCIDVLTSSTILVNDEHTVCTLASSLRYNNCKQTEIKELSKYVDEGRNSKKHLKIF